MWVTKTCDMWQKNYVCKESDEYCCSHGQQGIYCSATGVRRIGSRGANIHKPDP